MLDRESQVAIRTRLAKIKTQMEASRKLPRMPYIADHDAAWLVLVVEGLMYDVADLTDRYQRHADR